MARRRQAVTIKHVAADAGVSLQTVSRVINNEPNVRPEMKERVQSSIEKLGYVPSIAAQRMSGNRSYLIMALNDRERTIAHWQAREGNDWVDQMLLGGMLKCADYGYRLMLELIDTHDDHIERELNAAIASLQPDGIILTPPHSNNPKIINLLASEGIPFARIGARENGAGISISMDDERSAELATEHLFSYGHRRIGFIAGDPEYDLSGWRADGWRSAMKALDLPIRGLFEEGDFSLESGVNAARKLLGETERATAIIASNDQMAFGVIKVAAEMGLSIPNDLSLISFDNTPGVRFCQPALTAIDQPIAETASIAVDVIIAAQRGKLPTKNEIVAPAKLIERSSVAPPAN